MQFKFGKRRTHFIGVVGTANEIKEFGHWVRSGVGDFTLPGSCMKKRQLSLTIYVYLQQCSTLILARGYGGAVTRLYYIPTVSFIPKHEIRKRAKLVQ